MAKTAKTIVPICPVLARESPRAIAFRSIDVNLAFDIDPDVPANVRQDPEEFVSKLRIAAAA